MEMYDNELKEEYRKLYKAVFDYLSNNGLVTHFPVIGKNYEKSRKKFMLVGRALNGFDYKEKHSGSFTIGGSINNYLDDAMNAYVTSDDRFEFLRKENGKVGKNSAFWRTAKLVFEKLNNSHEPEWFDSIIWANIFPVAPSEGGNPSDLLCHFQVSAAKKILKLTIEKYKPKYILFETGWNDWMYYWDKKDKKMICMFEGVPKEERDGLMGKKDNIIWDGMIGDSAVVIACRPDRRKNKPNEEDYAKEIVEKFIKWKTE